MTHEKSFAVSRFQNRNGVTSWRVSGSIAGVRIRKNFPTREEAAAEMSALDSRAAQATSGQRTVATALTNNQLREAEAAFRHLATAPQSLSFYLDYGLANYRTPDRHQSLAEAVTAYLATKTAEQARHIISAPQLTTIRRHLKVLTDHFPAATVADLSALRLTSHFQRGNASLKTYNNCSTTVRAKSRRSRGCREAAEPRANPCEITTFGNPCLSPCGEGCGEGLNRRIFGKESSNIRQQAPPV